MRDTSHDRRPRAVMFAAALVVASAVPLVGHDATASASSPSPTVIQPGLCDSEPATIIAGSAGDGPVASEASMAGATQVVTLASDPRPTDEPKERGKTKPLHGNWRKMPRSPFSATNPVAVWAGDRMVAIDSRSGRTATYDPRIRRWEEHQPVPGGSFEGGGLVSARTLASTGAEVIAYDRRSDADDSWIAWHAFDPASGRWRDIAPSPDGLDAHLLKSGGALTRAGDLVIILAGDRSGAAYDPIADCWLEMPAAPLPVLSEPSQSVPEDAWFPRSVDWTGDRLVVVLGRDDPYEDTGIVQFDPGTWEWTSGSLGPIDGSLVDPVFANGKLWFMTEDPNGLYLGNATYDPSTDTWAEIETGCKVNTRWATWTGRFIMEPYDDRRAYDPATGRCLRTPASHDRARQWASVWTGREFLYWSGAYGDTSDARRDGIAYRPPRSAITSEAIKPVGKKLRRAILARRELGLDDDPETVREIRADPFQPGSGNYGFPMTATEYRELAAGAAGATTASLVKRTLRREPIFGGIWLDPRADGPIVIALTDADAEAISRIDRMVRGPWRLVIVPTSLRDLKRAFWRAGSVSKDVDPTAMLWAAGMHQSTGTIEMMYDPDDVDRMRARKKRLEKRLGVPVRITSGRVRDT